MPLSNKNRKFDSSTKGAVLNRPIVTLCVEKGGDAGKIMRLDRDKIMIGRDKTNDFKLTDLAVSGKHGCLTRGSMGYIYKDLGSRHGSSVKIDAEQFDLRSQPDLEVVIEQSGKLLVGRTLISVNVDSVSNREGPESTSRVTLAHNTGEQLIATQNLQSAMRHIKEQDPKFEILFKLAGELNRGGGLNHILALAADACFKAFPTANLFSVNMLEGGQLKPSLVRTQGLATGAAEVVVSRSMLKQVVDTGEAILYVHGQVGGKASSSIVEGNISACMCAPLVGQNNLLGVIQIDSRKQGIQFRPQDLSLFSILASNVALAVERAGLTEDIYKMFEGFAQAAVNAIEARDPVTAGHSERVAKYAIVLAEGVNKVNSGGLTDVYFTSNQLTELRYAALLHDFGKIGVRESVLTKGNRLEPGPMSVIAGRFEHIKDSYRHNRMEALLRKAVASGEPPAQLLLEQIEEQAHAFAKGLDENYHFLESILQKRALSEADIAQVRKIGATRVSFGANGEQNLLTAEELKNLTIPVGTLNDEEWVDMRSHVSLSQTFLSHIPWSKELRQVPCIAGGHHEKLDGSGYPLGIVDEQLPSSVRILTIADIFDAVTAWDRPYHKAMTVERAAEVLREEAARGKIDSDLVNFFTVRTIPKIIHLIPTTHRH